MKGNNYSGSGFDRSSGNPGGSGTGNMHAGSSGAGSLALGGIFLALTMVFMFGASFVPGVELTLYAFSSLFVGFMVIEKGPKQGIILYVAAALLGLILVPNKIGVLPYIAFFGYYGVLKFYIEKLHKPAAQVAVKVVFFAVIMFAALKLGGEILFGSSPVPGMPVAVFYVGGIAMMLVFDLIYTLAIKIYCQRIKRQKQPEFKLYKGDE